MIKNYFYFKGTLTELEKQIESKNEDIRLLRELVQKQYLEIKKIKSNRTHKTIHLF